VGEEMNPSLEFAGSLAHELNRMNLSPNGFVVGWLNSINVLPSKIVRIEREDGPYKNCVDVSLVMESGEVKKISLPIEMVMQPGWSGEIAKELAKDLPYMDRKMRGL
jgi:hypothetical protein